MTSTFYCSTLCFLGAPVHRCPPSTPSQLPAKQAICSTLYCSTIYFLGARAPPTALLSTLSVHPCTAALHACDHRQRNITPQPTTDPTAACHAEALAKAENIAQIALALSCYSCFFKKILISYQQTTYRFSDLQKSRIFAQFAQVRAFIEAPLYCARKKLNRNRFKCRA